jgi:mRNA interferase HigB
VRPALATALFRDGRLSLIRAARLATMSVADLAAHLSRLSIPVVRLDAAETTGASRSDVCPVARLPKWEILRSMRFIAKRSLQKFWERPGCADARGPLHSWYVEAVKATWRTPQDIKDQYASASICGNNRVVFNVGGNKYRLVVEIQYQAGIVWVKFVGTHAQYDRIDVETVNEC